MLAFYTLLFVSFLVAQPLHPFPPVGGRYTQTACNCTDMNPSTCAQFPGVGTVTQDLETGAIQFSSWAGNMQSDGSFSTTSPISNFDCAGRFFTPDSFTFQQNCTDATTVCTIDYACTGTTSNDQCQCQFTDSVQVPVGTAALVGFCNMLPNGTFIGPIDPANQVMVRPLSPGSNMPTYQVYIFQESEERDFLNSMPFQCENADCQQIRNVSDSFNTIVRTNASPSSNYSVYINCLAGDDDRCTMQFDINFVTQGCPSPHLLSLSELCRLLRDMSSCDRG